MQLDLHNQTFTTAQVAALLSVSPQAVIKRAKTRNWKAAPVKVQGGGNVWLFREMDEDTRNRLSVAAIREHRQEPESPEARQEQEARLSEMWEDFAKKPQSVKDRAYFRAGLLNDVLDLHEGGATLKAAFEAVASANDVSVATLRNWYFGIAGKCGVRGHDRKDWVAILTDRHRGRVVKADCDEIAWEFLKKDYLRRERPSFRSCYRRLKKAAKVHGWVIPSEKTLRRRLKVEIPQAVIDYMRTGKFVNPYPDQEVDRSSIPAGFAVSGDALSFDKIKVYDKQSGEVYSPRVWFFEDRHSGKILSWAGDKTENSDMFNRALYNLLGVCLPHLVTVDNTRAASNLDLMGQELGRHRFGHKSHHPVGKMKLMGIKVHFTNPDHEISSPGSKPIERAFGIGGLHSEARVHPQLMNRGTMNNPIHDAEFFEVILPQLVAEHNARTGRRGGICNGRSFDQVYAESLKSVSLRKASPQLRRLLLCKQESCKVSQQGTVTLKSGKGYGKHRYYSEALVPYAGEYVAVFFNPENLSEQVTVFDLAGNQIGHADWLQAVAFNDTKSAREHAKHRTRHKKLVKQAAKEAAKMEDLEFRQLNVTPVAGKTPAPSGSVTVLAPTEIRDMVSKPLDTETMNKFKKNMHRNIAAMA